MEEFILLECVAPEDNGYPKLTIKDNKFYQGNIEAYRKFPWILALYTSNDSWSNILIDENDIDELLSKLLLFWAKIKENKTKGEIKE